MNVYRPQRNSHVNPLLLRQNLSRFGGFIIEGDIGANLLHELYLFIRPGRADDAQPIEFCKLDDHRTDGTSTRGYEDCLAL